MTRQAVHAARSRPDLLLGHVRALQDTILLRNIDKQVGMRRGDDLALLPVPGFSCSSLECPSEEYCEYASSQLQYAPEHTRTHATLSFTRTKASDSGGCSPRPVTATLQVLGGPGPTLSTMLHVEYHIVVADTLSIAFAHLGSP